MPSIQLQIRKTNQDFTDKAERRVINGEDEYFLQKLWFKKIETMDERNDLFVEYREDELPEEVRTTLKNWYYQTGTAGAYTYEALPNPLTLSAAGTVCDDNGADVIPFF